MTQRSYKSFSCKCAEHTCSLGGSATQINALNRHLVQPVWEFNPVSPKKVPLVWKSWLSRKTPEGKFQNIPKDTGSLSQRGESCSQVPSTGQPPGALDARAARGAKEWETFRATPPKAAEVTTSGSTNVLCQVRIQSHPTPPPRFGKLKSRGDVKHGHGRTMNCALPLAWDCTRYLVHLGGAEQVLSFQKREDVMPLRQTQLRLHGARRPRRSGQVTPSRCFCPTGQAPPRPASAPHAQPRLPLLPLRPSPSRLILASRPLSGPKSLPNPLLLGLPLVSALPLGSCVVLTLGRPSPPPSH